MPTQSVCWGASTIWTRYVAHSFGEHYAETKEDDRQGNLCRRSFFGDDKIHHPKLHDVEFGGIWVESENASTHGSPGL